ncbi:MAG: DUF2793 domain-containing protein [Rhizobiaceae bacterium]|nr:DUF2793 domain-containing protein [Rhizobiaceae bacterium]
MEKSAILGLPYIMPSQAQAHVTHNTALDLLDALVQLGVESATATEPPTEPADGDRYIVPSDATGEWASHVDELAVFRDGGWLYLTPPAGALAWVKDSSVLCVHSGGGWPQIDGAGSGVSALTMLGINSAASTSQRLAVASGSTLLDEENGSHRLLVNKAAGADTASLILQTGHEARAELGLTGSDDFRLIVSADGAVWHDSLVATRASGELSAPNGLQAPGHVLQVQTARLTSTFTTSSAAPQATGLAVTITPRSSSSRVIVRANVVVGAAFWYTSPMLAIFRNGGKVWPSLAGVYLKHQLLADTESNSRLVSMSVPIEFEDEPATTNPVTYALHLASSLGGYPVHINRREHAAAAIGETNISATEIGG